MTDLLIECYVAAMETLNFTVAAQKLCISQPSFSRNIAALENEVGFQLFDRSKSSGLRPTPAGLTFYEGITDLLGRYRGLVKRSRDISRGEKGRLVICMLNGVVLGEALRDRIQQFRQIHPNVEVELMGCSMRRLEENVLHGDCDISLMMANIIRERERVSIQRLYVMDSYLAVPRSLGLDTRKRYRLSDFKDQPFILTEQFPALTEDFTLNCRDAGFEPHIRLAPNFESSMLWVSMDEGVAGVIRDHYTGDRSHIDFVRVEEIRDMDFSIVWRKDAFNPVIPKFCAFMDQFQWDGT